jgi:hypothetical protein
MAVQVVEPTAENINALFGAMRALTLAFTRQLPMDKQEDLRNDLSRLGKEAAARQDPLLEALLLDLHAAAGSASGAIV